MTEYWYFSDGVIKQMVRTNTGFLDVITGKDYSKHEFLQYVQGMQGHIITAEAFERLNAGQRTHEHDDG